MRDRKGNIEEQLRVGNAIISGDIHTYLPQKESVVLEWLLDRLDEQNGTVWRRSVGAWSLLLATWTAPNTDVHAKERALANHNMNSILLKTLGEADATALDVVSDFWATSSRDQMYFKSTAAEPSSALVSAYFKSAATDVALRRLADVLSGRLKHIDTKPYFGHNSQELLKSALQAVDIGRVTQSDLYEFTTNILANVLISDPKLKLKDSLKGQEYKRHDRIVEILFAAASRAQNAGSGATLNDIVLTFPQHLSLILGLAQKAGNKFDNEKLGKYALALLGASDDDDDVNFAELSPASAWSSLRFILEFNSTAVLKHIELVYWKISESVGELDARVDFAVRIIQVLSQSRRLLEFLSKWKGELVTKDIWRESRVVEAIEASVTSLSDYQIAQLLAENSDNDVVVRPIVAGLNKRTQSIVSAEIRSQLEKLVISSDISWESRYLIASLDSSLASDTVLKSVKLKESDAEIGALEFILRLRELMNVQSLPTMDKNFVATAVQNSEVLSRIADRWFVVMDRLLDKSGMSRLSQAMVNDEVALRKLLTNHEFFEQAAFCRSVLYSLIDSLVKTSDYDYKVRLLSHIPVDVMKKSQRVDFVNALVRLDGELRHRTSKKGKKRSQPEMAISDLVEIRTAIGRILERPTFQSKLETDVPTLVEFLESGLAQENLARVTFDISTSLLAELSKDSRPFVKDLSTAYSEMSFGKTKVVLGSILASAVPELLADAMDSVATFLRAGTSENRPELLRLIGTVLRASKDQDISAPRLKECLAELLLERKDGPDMLQQYFSVLALLRPSPKDIECLTAVHATIGKLHALRTLGQILTTDVGDASQAFEASIATLESGVFRQLFDQVVETTFMFKDSLNFKTLKCYGNVAAKLKESYSGIVALSVARFVKEHHTLDADAIVYFVEYLERLVRDGQQNINQFTLEMSLSLVQKLLAGTLTDVLAEQAGILFSSLCRLVSSVLLFHRHRISGRYHLVVGVFLQLLRTLSSHSKSWFQREGATERAAHAYSRLLSNLCEPPSYAVRERAGKASLSSTKAAVNRLLTKHLPVILIAYVDISLNAGFSSSVKDILRPSFYPVFDILGPEGVAHVGALLDASGRAYLRPIYEDYKRNGKWQD